jgi:hypothetical protein
MAGRAGSSPAPAAFLRLSRFHRGVSVRPSIFRWICSAALALAAAFPLLAPAQGGGGQFSKEQLDQMTAPIALYPDSLLSQVLMASTYPADVAAAAKWSRANSDKKGDDAVSLVQSEPWDPSVQSLVAFPQVIIMMGEKPEWVRDLGDAFLGQPDDVMASVQRLRAQAQKAGNLSSNKEVKVETETVTAEATGQPEKVIVIQQTSPQVVYVPTYNPTVVYGPWLWPAYPPYYIPPPPGYWFSTAVATGIAWGVGIGITNALWGNCNWGRGDVNINVNRYNNINVNNRINNGNWNHNVSHRGNVPYRGGEATRNRLDQKYQSGQREQFRGRDAQRAQAAQSMQRAGVNVDRAALAGRPQTRDMAAGGGRPQTRDMAAGGGRPQTMDRSAATRETAQRMNRDNAFRGAGDSNARAEMNRGASSRQSMQREARPSRSAGGGARPQQMSRPSGGGARAGGGGGARGGARGGGGRGGGGRGR